MDRRSTACDMKLQRQKDSDASHKSTGACPLINTEFSTASGTEYSNASSTELSNAGSAEFSNASSTELSTVISTLF
jgi:hypothetical protein